jgi:hypothetical protein
MRVDEARTKHDLLVEPFDIRMLGRHFLDNDNPPTGDVHPDGPKVQRPAVEPTPRTDPVLHAIP